MPAIRWTLIFGLCAASFATHAADPFTQTLDGAIQLSRHKLKTNRKDPVGKQLAEFVLALSKDNDEALLLLSAIDENLPVGAPLRPVTDEGKEYAAFLTSLAERFLALKDEKVKLRGLMFMAMAKEIDPLNRDARITLMRAKRAGQAVELPELLAAYTSDGATAAPKKTPRPAAAAPADDADSAKTRNLLKTVRISSINVSRSTSTINELSRFLKTYDVQIHVDAKHLDAIVSSSSSSYGYPYYSSLRFKNDPNSQHGYSSNYRRDVTLESVLRDVCRLWAASYRISGDRIYLTDPDHRDAAQDIGFLLTAKQLVDEFESNASKASMKYRNKPIELVAPVSKLTSTRSIGGGRTLYLYDNKIQLQIDDMSENDFKSLEQQFESISRDASYSSSSRHTTVVMLSVTAVCRGQRVGRVILDDGDNASWRIESYYRRD